MDFVVYGIESRGVTAFGMTAPPPPNRLTLAFVTLLLAASGLLMILHGLGVVSAKWFNPNPDAPTWVFTATGLFLLVGGLLTAHQIRPLPSRLFMALGWSAVALGMVMANWLVFFAEGASCGISGAGFAADGLGLACRGAAALVVLLFDVVLLLALLTRKPNSGARS